MRLNDRDPIELSMYRKKAEKTPGPADSSKVEACLAGPAIHRTWISAYRSGENEEFFSLAFDYIARTLGAPVDSLILDAGCGTGDHAIRLAKRGFIVEAIDISDTAVSLARRAVSEQGLAGRINVRAANLRCLPFTDGLFPYALCWGVLMHIPEVERAVAELSRVLAPGGMLVIGENNLHSVQSLAMRALLSAMGRSKDRFRRTASGIEEWQRTEGGMLMTRDTDMGWLTREAARNGLILKKRVAGQASNLYAWLSSPLLKKATHSFNRLWFRHVRLPYLAFANILIFMKRNS